MDEIVNETPAPAAETAQTETAQPAATNAYLDSIKVLKVDFEKFVAEAEKGYSNKAAAGRARKMSLALRKNLQEWRELCIANDKVAK
jgi:hypothetical protein